MNELQTTYTEKALTLDSREVAEMTNMDHSKLMRNIRTYSEYLAEAKIGLGDYFIESTYLDANKQERPCYLLTKLGCELVSNKLTGPKGVIFTAKYVAKFNTMENSLKPKNRLDAASLIHQEVTELLAATKEIDDRVYNLENNMTIDYSQQLELKLIANKRVMEVLGGKDVPAYKEVGKKAFRSIWTDFQKALGVNSYRNTAVKNYEVAKKYVSEWNPNRELELMILGSNSQLRIVE